MTRCEISNLVVVVCVTTVAMFCASAYADSASLGGIKASADATHLTVGDLFWYTATVQLPADSRPVLPGADAEFPGFEVRDYQEETTTLPDGTQQIEIRYQLVTFTVGEKQIADFEVQAERTVDGQLRTDKYLAPPVKITVESVLPPQGAEPKPIYGPLFLAPWWYSWLKPLGIALAVLVVVVVTAWLWARRKRSAQGTAEIPLTPHEAACLALQKLGDSSLIASGQLKAFYSELSDIMRRWLEYRIDIRAMELTTGLIRYDLRNSDLQADWQEQYIELLRRGDLVKFAKWTPDDGVAYGDLDLAVRLLEREAPVEPKPDAAQGTEPDEGAAA